MRSMFSVALSRMCRKEAGQSRNRIGPDVVAGVSRRKASSLETQLKGKSWFEKESLKSS